jgi:bifunctional polynucleotide phosphatase/kinase
MAPGSLKRSSSTDRDLSPPPTKRKLAASATNKAVANFFKPASEKEPEKVSSKILHETLFIARNENAHTIARAKPVKIAAFDFDDTLIATKSGLKFGRGEDDWKWWHASVPARLKQLHADGYALVVISNQAAISLRTDNKTIKDGMRSLNNLKGKAAAVFKALDLPMSLYAATEYDIFRKPRVGMWEQLTKDYGLSGDGDVDLEKSIFVGDAAGRTGDPKAGVKKDHSCSDRDFAANVGIGFMTPEEFFSGEDVKPFTRSFDPAAYMDTEITSQTDDTSILFSKKNDLELVIFCGSPGAGKSTFYWQHMQPLGYERVNQDILKTRDRCMKVATDFIEDKKSVVVDNTNADIETRAAWLSLGQKLKVPTRLVHFTVSTKLCEHNNAVRAFTGDLVRFHAALFRGATSSHPTYPLLLLMGGLSVHVYGSTVVEDGMLT